MSQEIIKRAINLLNKAKVFYFLTVDGDKPKGRPFSFFMEYNGKIIFGTGTHKECYRQIQENPNVEVVAFSESEFMRYDGEIDYIDDEELKNQAFSNFSYLSKLYSPENGRIIRFFTLKNASIEFCSMAGEHKEKFSL